MEGKIWSKFQSKKTDGSIQEFSVRDCTQDQMEDVFDIYYNYFLTDESFHKLSGVPYSEEAKIECKPLLAEMLKEKSNHIVVCVEESTGNVVGVSSMKLQIGVDDKMPKIKLQSKEMAKLFQMLNRMIDFYDITKKYCVEKWYDGRGVIVHPDYRNFGIGSALVQSRRKICKEQRVPITCAWMTSIGTQIAAERDGWETEFEIDSREFARQFDTTPYDGIAPTFKVMMGKP
ncbi:uncharacterized protein LOC128673766 [Plodia interpunctella]|uniref:uncharacterized protein LOC128673766 n=1 Tax=Plodia interpunctella TaxID=58824 RepID=UPI002368D5CA|nr:uncharacterized protein LOC128673766 [Plodia interpunctella]